MSEPRTERIFRMVLAGRVQGVGFRYFTRQAAERLGVAGWVRNLPNGDVEVRAAGSAAALEAFRRQLRQGPPGSRVDSLSESELPAGDGWTGFHVAY